MMGALKRNTRIIFEHAAIVGGDPFSVMNWRYIPRANGASTYSWDVFDKKEDRFLSQREVRRLSEDQCREKLDAN